MYKALYRKYRPDTFNDVVGQKNIIQTLSNSILNDKITHAYLFTGPRGTGKTSVAKILAKIVNCEALDGVTPCNKCNSCMQIINKQNTDIIEIDAASNNGVDEIRDLREKVGLVPAFGKYKVYIIDEVHMLTTAAFNALLKTLEEPPKHIIFILATTEPHKIPATILSRCQRFDFKKISENDICDRIKYICTEEKIKISDDAIKLISKLSDGGMRDSLSLLDQLTSYTTEQITGTDVHNVCGTITNDEICVLLTQIKNKDVKSVFTNIQTYDSEGKNLNKIVDLLIEFLKNTLIFLNSSDFFENENDKKNYETICSIYEENIIYSMIEILLETSNNKTGNARLLLELAVIKIFSLFNQNIVIEKTEQIEKYAKPKKIVTEVIQEKPQLDEKMIDEVNKLKNIRINNTLCYFNKSDLLKFKNEMDQIKELLLDTEYSSNVSLILDGELKAKGNNNIIIVYSNDNLSDCFNYKLDEIEKIFKKSFNDNFYPIAVSQTEWDKIKKEFNENLKNNIKKYEYIEEPSKTINSNNITQEESTEIDNMFDEIIEYN